MRILNFGSMNVDNVYSVDHVVVGGETISSTKREVFCGGKGLNQSVALARAGASVCHAGAVGTDGDILLEACRKYGVDISLLRRYPVAGGHTVIQVDKNGQNCIILYGGTNQMQTKEYVDEVMSHFGPGDYLVLQNEINLLDYIIDKAYEKGLKIVLNPSPFDDKLKDCDMSKIWLFMLNEIEGEQFTGIADFEGILGEMIRRYPQAKIVLTLGSQGAWYADSKERIFQDIFPVKAVDTTAAGDTFTGFFVTSLVTGKSPAESLRIAAKASSIAVTRPGAAPSIPSMEEVRSQLV